MAKKAGERRNWSGKGLSRRERIVGTNRTAHLVNGR